MARGPLAAARQPITDRTLARDSSASRSHALPFSAAKLLHPLHPGVAGGGVSSSLLFDKVDHTRATAPRPQGRGGRRAAWDGRGPWAEPSRLSGQRSATSRASGAERVSSSKPDPVRRERVTPPPPPRRRAVPPVGAKTEQQSVDSNNT